MDSQINVLLLLLLTVFSAFQFMCSSFVNSKSITLSLSLSRQHNDSSKSKREELHRLARASSARAQSFNQSKVTTPHLSNEDDVPLFPRGYGGYSVDLSFGSPPQTLSFVMDTGSSLVWFPCTSYFTCHNCTDFKGVGEIQPFLPEDSKSSEKVACDSKQCKWIAPIYECHTEEPYCPGFRVTYGSGEMWGSLLSEFLNFPQTRLENFIVGCSDEALNMPSGIAGFGRAPYSLPAQMGLDSFSYCMASQYFDDNNTGTVVSSDLVLTKGPTDVNGSAPKGIVQYTPFINNRKYQKYYYVRLQNITVGDVNVTVRDEYQLPDVYGNGGTIVDSGTTLTVMDESVLDLVVNEFERQLVEKNNNNIRNTEAEFDTGLGLCFNVSSFDDLPTLTLHFEGGAVMDLLLENYFQQVEKLLVCMTMMRTPPGIDPAIILGNYLQQDFYVEYDLKNERLGLLKHTCNTK